MTHFRNQMRFTMHPCQLQIILMLTDINLHKISYNTDPFWTWHYITHKLVLSSTVPVMKMKMSSTMKVMQMTMLCSISSIFLASCTTSL